MGGKSTLSLNLLNYARINNLSCQLYSDDVVLVDQKLNVHSLIIRVSLPQDAEVIGLIPDQFKRKFTRYNKPDKWLISWEFFKGIWSKTPTSPSYIVSLKFTKGNESTLEPIGRFKAFTILFRDLVVGYGLPQIVEFFLKDGLFSIIKKIPTLFKRLLLAIRIVFCSKSKFYVFWQSSDYQKNCKSLLSHLKR